MMHVIEDHPTVHLDVERACAAGESATVLSADHPHVEHQRALAQAYEGEPALITWTKGTTGRPKGVVIPWPAVAARCAALAQYWRPEDIAVTTSAIWPSNSGSIITSRIAVHRAGGRFVPQLEQGVTCITGIPSQLAQIPDQMADSDLLADLRLVVTIGAKLHDDRRERIAKAGVPIAELYGTSEAGGASFDGVPLVGYEIETRAENEIFIRSQGLAAAYLGEGRPLAITDGWLATGDAGLILEDGRLRVKGRRKTTRDERLQR